MSGRRFVALDSESWAKAVDEACAGDVITIAQGWGVIIDSYEELPAVGVLIEASPPEGHDPKVTLSRSPMQEGGDWREGWVTHSYGRWVIEEGGRSRYEPHRPGEPPGARQ
jgi:hypothetical protein